jgi:cell division transport system permease protein
MTFRFLIAEGLASVRRVAAASTIGAALTGVALAIVGGFALLALAYRADLSAARASAAVEVFLRDGVDSARAANVAGEMTSFPLIRSARVRSREEALQLFGAGMGDDTTIVGDDLPLPTTIQLELEESARSVAGMEALGARLREINDVEDVAFPSELVRLVDERSAIFLRIAITIGVALSLSVIGVVANTAQLTVVTQRSVIRTMRLLGAETRWVLAPFIIQGFLIGLAGGLVAALLLYGAWLLIPDLEGALERDAVRFLPLLFPIAGALLGSLGALLASGYYLRRNRIV